MTETAKTVDQLDAEVKEAEANLEARRTDAEKIFERLAAALVPIVQAYYERTTTNIAVEESAVTTKNAARLSTIKEELKTMIATELPQKVPEWLSQTDWPHRKHSKVVHGTYGWRVDPSGDKGPRELSMMFEKHLTSHLQAAMNKYGYHAPHHYGPQWKGEPVAVIAEYEKLLEAYLAAKTRHENAVRERQRFEAKSLWEKA